MEKEPNEEYNTIIATYSVETFYRVPKHITADRCFIKYGTLQYEDNGTMVETDKCIENEIDYKYPSDITDGDYEDFQFFFE